MLHHFKHHQAKDYNLYKQKETPMTNASLRTTQLLVVDDDPSMVRLLAKVIERQFADGNRINQF